MAGRVPRDQAFGEAMVCSERLEADHVYGKAPSEDTISIFSDLQALLLRATRTEAAWKTETLWAHGVPPSPPVPPTKDEWMAASNAMHDM